MTAKQAIALVRDPELRRLLEVGHKAGADSLIEGFWILLARGIAGIEPRDGDAKE
jgi:hypothetical protein